MFPRKGGKKLVLDTLLMNTTTLLVPEILGESCSIPVAEYIVQAHGNARMDILNNVSF